MTKNENGMAGHGTDAGDVLDFPGADQLVAAGSVAPPRAETVQAALVALRRAMAEPTGGGALPPVPDMTEVAADSTGPGGVTQAATGIPADEEVTLVRLGSDRPAPRQRARRGGRMLIAAAVVVATAGAATLLPAVGDASHRPAAEANAADFLNQVADTADASPVPSGSWWKVSTHVSVSGPHANPPHDMTEWLGRDRILHRERGGPVVQFSGPANYWEPTTDGRAMFALVRHAGRADATVWSLEPNGSELTWDQLMKLPQDPTALRAALLRRIKGPEPERQLFDDVTMLLSEAPAPAPLRAALFKVAAHIPGVRLLGKVKDTSGREGTAVELRRGSETSRVIVDPRTSKTLEQRFVFGKNPAHGDDDSFGMVITYLSSNAVSAAPAVR